MERLTKEREQQIRESAEHYKILSPEWSHQDVRYGYGQIICFLLAELDATRDELDEVTRERDLLNVIAQNQIVCLSGGACAVWKNTTIRNGCAWEISGRDEFYPTALDAIRSAMKKGE